MAIYQYQIFILPKKELIKRHGLVLDSLELKSKNSIGVKLVTKTYWSNIKVNTKNLIKEIDSIIQRDKWGNGKTHFLWKSYEKSADNDVCIDINEKSLIIDYFSFRIDLKENELNFLFKVIELGKNNNWIFMDQNGTLMNPNIDEVRKSIKKSNANKFLKNPITYLENINK